MSKTIVTAVLVEVNAAMGAAKAPFCEVAGVELSVAPKRAPKRKLKSGAMSWVPYGERVAGSQKRDSYVKYIVSLFEARAQQPDDGQVKISFTTSRRQHGLRFLNDFSQPF